MKDVPINKLYLAVQVRGVIYPDPTASDIPTALNVGLIAGVSVVLIVARTSLYQGLNHETSFPCFVNAKSQRILAQPNRCVVLSVLFPVFNSSVPQTFQGLYRNA